MTRGKIAGSVTALLTFAALIAAQGNNPAEQFERAQRLQEAGKVSEAIDIYQQIVKQPSKDSDRTWVAMALTEMGFAYLDVSKDEAQKVCRRVLSEFRNVGRNIVTRAELCVSRASAPEGLTAIPTEHTGDPYSLAISPDGRSLVYQGAVQGKVQLILQQPDTGKKIAIPGSDNGRYPFWKPDGRSIGFFANSKLKRVDVEGANFTNLIELADATTPFGGAWSRSGIVVFAKSSSGPLYSVPELGGAAPVGVTRTAGTEGDRFPQFAPDGRHFLYFHFPARAGEMTLMLGSLGSRETQQLRLPAASQPQAAAFDSGRLLYVDNGALFAQNLDQMTPLGAPTQIIDRVAINPEDPGIAALSVSNGRIAYRDDTAVFRQFKWVDRKGQTQGVLGEPDKAISTAWCFRLSPDDQTVAYQRLVGGDTGSLWTMNTIDGIRSSAQIGFGGSPTWVQGKAPLDFGDQIAFGNMPPPDWIPIHLDADVPSSSFQQVPEMRKVRVLPNLYRIFPDGSGGSWLHLSPDAEFPNDWLDNFVLYTRTTNATATLEDLFVQPRSEAPVVPVANSPARELNGRFSPKGDWIVYQSNEAGDRFEIYVQAFPGSARFRKDVSHKGGTNPQWRRKDGREIYFLSSDNDVMAAPVTPSADGRDIEIGAPVALFPAPAGTGFDASSDGERFLINAPVDDTGPPIRILTDWAPTSLSAPGALSARPPQPAPTTSATAARSNTNGGPIAGPLKQITIFDKNGNRLRAVGIPGLWDQIAISPDATQVAFSRGTELFVVDTRTDTTSTITVDLLRNTSFGFSPGSQYIAFVSTVRPSELRPTTTSPTVILTRMFSNGIGVQSRAYPGVTNFSNWSTDFYMLNSGNRQLAVAPNRTLPAVSLAVAGGNTPLRLSPNSRYIAYVSNEDGSPQVWVRPFNPASTAPLSAAVKITTDGAGGMVRWRADGQELYYLSSDGRIMAVPITTRPEIKAGPSTPLFRLPLGVGIDGDISADGQRFVFLEYVPAATSGR